VPEWLPTPANLRAKRDLEVLDRVVMGMIDQRRASGEDHGDLLSMLLLARDEEDRDRAMTDKQVRDEAMTLFIAGHETTANALAWTFYLLAQHPAAAATLRAELDAVLGGRAPMATDLPSLLYTEMVVKESMRLYPPAWIIPRYVVAPLTLNGYTVAPGSTILISPYVLHHTARHFANPERFMPERFAGAVEDSIPRYAYLPFGAGPRVCIGNSFAMMESRLVLATLLQRFELELLPGQVVTPRPLVTLRPRGGIQMALRARQRVLAAVW
jgi:cytochrome P450